MHYKLTFEHFGFEIGVNGSFGNVSNGHLDYKPGEFMRDTSRQYYSVRVYRLRRENSGQNPGEYHSRSRWKQKRPKGNLDTMNSEIRGKKQES